MSKGNVINLNSKTVNDLFMALLFQKDEVVDGKPVVEPKTGEGIRSKAYGFFPARIEEKKDEIKQLLLQLPKEFMKSGGGWSFLNACMTSTGEQWTSFHEQMEQLFAMGNALGLCEYQTPREMWSMFPGGMPYVVVNDN